MNTRSHLRTRCEHTTDYEWEVGQVGGAVDPVDAVGRERGLPLM